MGSYQDLYKRLKDDPEALQREIEDVVRVNRESILTDMLRQAQVYMTWGYLHALAETDARRLKLNMEEDVLPAARVKAIAILEEQKRKATVQAKDDIARNDPSYKQIQGMVILANERVTIFRRVVEALGHKRDMLQSLNSRQKVELTALPEDSLPGGWHKTGPSSYCSGPLNPTEDNETCPHTEGRVLDAHQEGHLTPNHENVEAECADLARKYRDLRKKK